MVHQHFTSVPAFTVAENVALAAGWPVAPGRAPRAGARSWRAGRASAGPRARAERLSVGLRQRLEIVKALAADARILLLDEPTAVLAPAEVAELLRVIRRFTASGGSAVLITHKLDEALSAADRVTVLRRGEVVLAAPVAARAPRRSPRAMIGGLASERDAAEPLAGAYRRNWQGAVDASVRLESIDVATGGRARHRRARRVADGARRERSSASRRSRGTASASCSARSRAGSTRSAASARWRQPVAFIPEDRSTEGLIPEMTLTENLVLGSSGDRSMDPRPRDRLERGAGAHAAELMRRVRRGGAGPSAPAATLSGGNQQRLVVARELARGPP